jgi:hypothetical protein
MTDFIVDLAKTVGSISGIFAATFLLWDRWVKHFPVAILVARPLIDGSQHIEAFLLIKNVSDRPVLISWDNGDRSTLRLAKDQTTRGILQTFMYDQTIVSLGPEAEVYLPVLKPGDYEEIDPDNVIELHLRWKFAQPRVWMVDRRIRVSLRKRDFDNMIEGYMDNSKVAESDRKL